MRKKILILPILFLTSTLLLPSLTLAIDQPVPPTVPDEQTQESVADYNNKVDEYNNQVDEYNNQVDQDYEQQVQEYNNNVAYNEQQDIRVEELNKQEDEKVENHNQQENQKVQQNEQDLQQYEQDLQQYEEKHNKYEQEDLPKYKQEYQQYEKDLKNEQIVKTYYGAESVEDYNMTPFKTPDSVESGEYQDICENQAVDRREVRENNEELKESAAQFSSTIEVIETPTPTPTPTVTPEPQEYPMPTTYEATVTHHFMDPSANVIKDVVFTITANIEDVIKVTDLSKDNTGTKKVIEDNNDYSIFYAYIDDRFLNYYWYPNLSIADYTKLKNPQDFTEDNLTYTYSLKDGAYYYSDNYFPYFAVDYYYSPYLTINKPIEPEKPEQPEKPTEVEKYEPDYWEPEYVKPVYKELITPTKKEYLEKKSHIEYTPKEEEQEARPPSEGSQDPKSITPTPAPATPTPYVHVDPTPTPTYIPSSIDRPDNQIPLTEDSTQSEKNLFSIAIALLMLIFLSYRLYKAEL